MASRKIIKAQEFRDLSVEELQVKAEELRRALYIARSNRKNPKSDSPQERFALKKEVARVLTILKEKELKAAVSEG